jgi:hypothetical protein
MTQFYSQLVIKLVKARTSVRTFLANELEPSIKQQITEYMVGAEGFAGSSLRLILVDKAVEKNKGTKLGTYGIIRGAQHFIVAVVDNKDASAYVSLGYKLEKVVLFATSIGLGTVWLGGTFSKDQFAMAASLKDNETLSIVIPVGYATEKRSIIERLMRSTSKADSRKAFAELFFDGGLSKSLENDGVGYALSLEAVRLAPSAMNAQPWRVIKAENGFHFYLLHKNSNFNKSVTDMHKIDMGIGMCHFELVSREEGLSGSWNFAGKQPQGVPENFEYIASWQCE